MATKSPTEQDISQAADLFNAIATLALRADRLCFFNNIYAMQDNEEKQLLVDQLRSMVCTIGMYADMGAERVNGMVAKGGAAEWLLPQLVSDGVGS